MKNLYCTYFNSGYLDRAIVLLRSLSRYDPKFKIEILCFDDVVVDFFNKHRFDGVTTISLLDFEKRNPDLVAVKPSRSVAEYFFTCTSCWTADVARRHMDVDFITYLDCDMCFYSSPQSAFSLMQDKDIMVCPHYFSYNAEKMIKWGKYNVGWITFRTNAIGIDCLTRWRQDCIDWCFDKLEANRFADQKYLDYWPERYGNHLVEAPITINLGPWGIASGSFSVIDGAPCINGEKIVVYHYQGLRLYSNRHFYAGHCFHQSIVNIMKWLYEPYIRNLIMVRSEFSLDKQFGNSRRANGGILRKLMTGYWVGHPYLSEIIRWAQRIVK